MGGTTDFINNRIRHILLTSGPETLRFCNPGKDNLVRSSKLFLQSQRRGLSLHWMIRIPHGDAPLLRTFPDVARTNGSAGRGVPRATTCTTLCAPQTPRSLQRLSVDRSFAAEE
jgi:hypothetical protein